MTNKDKFLRDGVSVEELIQNLTNYINKTQKPTYEKIKNFFEQKAQLLTEDERVILRNIPKNHTRIRRSTYKDKICGKELAPLEIVDEKGKYYTLYILSHLFQFIKERRRIRDKGVIK